MDAIRERYEVLLCSAARRLTGAEHRSFLAEATLTLCDGHVRRAERQFERPIVANLMESMNLGATVMALHGRVFAMKTARPCKAMTVAP